MHRRLVFWVLVKELIAWIIFMRLKDMYVGTSLTYHHRLHHDSTLHIGTFQGIVKRERERCKYEKIV